jgi:hypothetical protein
MFNNPRKEITTAEAQSLSTRGMGKVMRYLRHVSPQAHQLHHRHGDAARRCLHLGTSADMDGFRVGHQKGYRGHRDLTLHSKWTA